MRPNEPPEAPTHLGSHQLPLPPEWLSDVDDDLEPPTRAARGSQPRQMTERRSAAALPPPPDGPPPRRPAATPRDGRRSVAQREASGSISAKPAAPPQPPAMPELPPGLG